MASSSKKVNLKVKRKTPIGRQAMAVRSKKVKPMGMRKTTTREEQPMASLGLKLSAFISRYGCKPVSRSALWRQVQRTGASLDNGLDKMSHISPPTLRKADVFLKSFNAKEKMTKWNTWAAQMRCRAQLDTSSELWKALQVHAGWGRSQSVLMQRSAADGAHSSIDTTGAVAAIAAQADGWEIRYAPMIVVNWLHQAIVDTMCVFREFMGTCAFDAQGSPTGSGFGEIVLWWGSHLGSIRDQAMIAWDYDADLALFVRPDCDVDSLWRLVSARLAFFGYNTARHGVKMRVCPKDPLCWAPYKELMQETREANANVSRKEILIKTARLWKAGSRAKRPHGSNCVDIDMYKVYKERAVIVAGTSPISCPLDKLFPTADGVFGPLRLPVPGADYVLRQEYGENCSTCRMVKTITKGGVPRAPTLAPPGARHSVWPNTPMVRCPEACLS